MKLAFGTFLVLLCTFVRVHAQFVDDFTDGEFAGNPSWSGNETKFSVAANQLKLNDLSPGANNAASLSVASTAIASATWEFSATLSFNPSGANLARVYLVSNHADLNGSLNGYLVSIGDTGDEICLYRQNGNTRAKIIDGIDGRVNMASVNVRVRVTRDLAGNWSLYSDVGVTGSFVLEGTATDNTFLESAHAGVQCVYTATRSTHFSFDDFVVTGIPQPDEIAPSVQSVIVSSESELAITFSEGITELSANTLSNYSVNAEIGNPTSAVLQPNGTTVLLGFGSSFTNGFLYQVSLTGLADLAGNEMLDAAPSFRYFVAEPAEFNDLVFNELFPDPSPQIGLPTSEFVEVVNRSSKAFDLTGWKIMDVNSQTILPTQFILPGEHLILCSSSATSEYELRGMTLGLSGMPTLNNSNDGFFLIDPLGQKIDSVFYALDWYQDEDKAQGGFTLERLNPDENSNQPTNWRASAAGIGGTPGQQNSVFGLNPDAIAPQLDTLLIVSDTQLLIVFTEPILFPSGEVTVDRGIGGPLDFELSSQADSLTLHFPSLTNGVSYALQLLNISDLAGNILTVIIPFTYFVPSAISAGDILFSEIMFDPSPVVQLPEAEFLEIRNVSHAAIDLEQWALADGADTTFLKKHILLPGEYLVLTSSTGSAALAAHTVALPVVNFPSLTNSGERLLLLSPGGLLVDSVHYHPEWLADDQKRDGGWSLERLRFELGSSEPTNWRACTAATGGTPGKQNSLYGANPDIKKPSIESIEVVDSRNCKLKFSELMNEASIVTTSHFVVNRSVGNPTEVHWNSSERTAVLTFGTDLTNGLTYELTIEGVEDLGGNSLVDTVTIRYLVLVDPIPGNLVINEIMFDPTPAVQLAEAEFIEIYNNSNKPFDLAGWRVADATDTTVLKSWVLLPGTYVLLTTSSGNDAIQENLLPVTGFPSLNNTGERIMLLSPAGAVIDSVHYQAYWLKDEAKMEGGWSLERLQFIWNGLVELNWRASVDASGGTPGFQNSLAGAKPDNLPPTPLEVVALNNFELKLSLSEPVRLQNTQEVPNFFLVEANESPNSVTPLDNLTLKLTFPHGFTNGTTYHLRVLGLVDTVGNRLDTAWLEFLFFTPTAVRSKDIIITEIMSDPIPTVRLAETEYIEIFNRSENAHDLGGWIFTDGNSRAKLPSIILLPNHYLLFTATSSSTPSSPVPILKLPNFPSLNNEGESIWILDAQGRTIDSVNFHVAWFRNSEKAEGGWSLELIDPQNPCGEEDNWAPSEDESGGTPGRDNSVSANKPDVTGPMLLSVVPLSDVELDVSFNETLGKNDIREFSVAPDRAIGGSYFTDHSLKSVRVQLNTPLNQRVLYTFTARVSDCSGNSIQNDFNSKDFALPEQAVPGDVIINEVLFNPNPDGVDFVELYNRSLKFINLKNLMIGNTSNFSSAKPIVSQDRLLSPGSFSVITFSGNTLSNHYLNLAIQTVTEASLPTMPDDEGELVIVNEVGNVVDSLHYDRSFHSPLLKDVEGISLERISEDQPTNSVANWTSALKASGFATPGIQNSNSRPSVVQQGTLVVEPMVISSTRSPYTLIHYQFDDPGYVATLKILDGQGALIRILASNEPLGFSGTFKWEAETEEGTRARQGYYVIWLEAYNLNGAVKTIRERVIVSD